MKEIYIRILLNLVKKDRDIDSLLMRGLTYSDIADIIDYAVEIGFIEFVDDRLLLTDDGFKKLNESSGFGYKGWILPDDRSKIDNISKYDVFLPKKKYTFF